MSKFKINVYARSRDAIKTLLDYKDELGLSKDEITCLELMSISVVEELEDIEQNNIHIST